MSDLPLEIVARHRIVPVLAVESVDHAVPLAKALQSGGLPIAEVTFRTDAAADVIRAMAAEKELLVGAGTVLRAEQVDQAVDSGARFAVSPGFNPQVVRRCIEVGLPIIPGVSTPSDLDMALEHGLEVVKFFPAEALGGVVMLRALAAPYRMLRFVPTGGIGPKNLQDYLALPQVIACGGSWMVKPDLYKDGDYSAVENAVRDALALAKT